jgi:hypothetical protein
VLPAVVLIAAHQWGEAAGDRRDRGYRCAAEHSCRLVTHVDVRHSLVVPFEVLAGNPHGNELVQRLIDMVPGYFLNEPHAEDTKAVLAGARAATKAASGTETVRT